VTDVIRISDLASPRLPGLVRWGNRLGAPLARRFVSLEEETLLAKARRKAGLSDFGSDSFREGLSVLLAALEAEAGLSALGRVSTQQFLLQLLSNRLRIEDLFARHPEIANEQIDRPLIIAGLPRTGTTHLHNLISRHPGLRSLPYWESLEPVPVAGETPGRDGRDPRIVRTERGLEFLHRVMPLFPAMHEMTWDAVHEEIQLLAIEFSTMLFESSYDIPSYRDWYKHTDQRPAYRYLRRTLQALQWLRGPRRWVLKSPQHLEQLGPLIETFPDATIVQTHRDPLRITASLCTMISYGSRMQAARVDPRAKGRYWAERVEDLLRGSIEGRVYLPEERVIDVHFQDFMKDDLATVERVLAHADVPLDDAARAAIRHYLDASPRGRHGRIAYPLEDVGLDPTERRAALRFYSDHFGVADE
jgi:hypothetical protein